MLFIAGLFTHTTFSSVLHVSSRYENRARRRVLASVVPGTVAPKERICGYGTVWWERSVRCRGIRRSDGMVYREGSSCHVEVLEEDIQCGV